MRSRAMRWLFNWAPAYRGTGARVIYIASDLKEIKIKLPLNLRTRNYVGTIYGGSMYGAVDPVYMLMLIHLLGKRYIVWDRAASIRFLKPGRSTLYATFVLNEAELERIRALAEEAPSIDRVYTVELVDGAGTVCAHIEKTLYIKKKPESNPQP